jgi:hypothetical protein
VDHDRRGLPHRLKVGPVRRGSSPLANPRHGGGRSAASPYFQSISLGLECAFFLAGHLGNRDLAIDEIFGRYEDFMYRQWLRVYMRTQMIKHNKDLLESVDDTPALLEKLHIF